MATKMCNAWIDFDMRSGRVISHYFCGLEVTEKAVTHASIALGAQKEIKRVLEGADEFFTTKTLDSPAFSVIRVADISSATLRYSITEE